MNQVIIFMAHYDISTEYMDHTARLERLKALPLKAFNYNPVYRIMLIWECQQYIRNIDRQLDLAFLN